MKNYYDERMLLHKMPSGIFSSLPSPLLEKQIEHPEATDQILNTVSVLKRGPLANQLRWETPVCTTDDELLKFYLKDYQLRLNEASQVGEYLSPSTYLPWSAQRCSLA